MNSDVRLLSEKYTLYVEAKEPPDPFPLTHEKGENSRWLETVGMVGALLYQFYGKEKFLLDIIDQSLYERKVVPYVKSAHPAQANAYPSLIFDIYSELKGSNWLLKRSDGYVEFNPKVVPWIMEIAERNFSDLL
jgi:hypothetical protein